MSKTKNIIIFGAGGNSRDIIDTIGDINRAYANTYKCVGILDDEESLWGKEVMGVKVLGPIKNAVNFPKSFFVNGIYSVKKFFINEEIIKSSLIPLNRFEKIIHPTSLVSETATIDVGSVLLKNVVIMSNVVIGKHVTIHPGAVISHDTYIGDYSFIANTVSTGGYVKIDKSCFIGLNSTIRDRVQIGSYSIVGMGSTVLKDIPSGKTYTGNPAKPIKFNADARK